MKICSVEKEEIKKCPYYISGWCNKSNSECEKEIENNKKENEYN